MKNSRYLGDANPNRIPHFHDLENIKPSCSVNFIKWGNHDVAFPTRAEARAAGYLPCLFCLPYEPGAS